MLFLSAVSFSLLAVFAFSYAYAQTPTDNFTTYQNPNLGFSIKYSSEWIAYENSTEYRDEVELDESTESTTSIFAVKA